MIVLGLKCYSHDTGAAILSDRAGSLQITAISEARLNRRKHSFTYPLMSIAYCLDSLGLASLDQVDLICIDRHMEKWPERGSQFGYANALARHHPRYDDNHRWNYLVEQTIKLDRGKVRWINHVDAHAASAYYVSPFEDAAVLIVEGGTGIYHGKDLALTTIDRIGYLGDTYRGGEKLPQRIDHFVNSSYFYDAVSSRLGYDVFGAGQTMALAGYADKFAKVDLIDVDPDRFDGFIINHDKTVFAMDHIPQFGGGDSEDLVAETWVNLARQAQETLTEDILYLAWLARKRTHARNLCLAGGAALNCIINRQILESGLFRDLYIQPAASDEGIPLGCALEGYYASGGTRRAEMDTAYLGRANDPGQLAGTIEKWRLKATKASPDAIALRLRDGDIIGRIAGRSEYGPRALGNRSILADPRPAAMKDKVNREIKHRESFRPFAPSCLADRTPGYLNAPRISPFMIIAGRVDEDSRGHLPAVTHVDGSCRVQTVTAEQNQGYYDLIQAFGDLTGCYVLLNTSFNDQGEPIVETYDDAISCYLRTGLDGLYIEDQLIEKTEDGPDADKLLENTFRRIEGEYTDLIERFCNSGAYVALAAKLNDEEKLP